MMATTTQVKKHNTQLTNACNYNNLRGKVKFYCLIPKQFSGEMVRIEVTNNGRCREIPYLASRISSIDTRGKCFMLYENFCSGREVRMAPGTRSHQDLRGVDFDNIATSIKRC